MEVSVRSEKDLVHNAYEILQRFTAYNLARRRCCFPGCNEIVPDNVRGKEEKWV